MVHIKKTSKKVLSILIAGLLLFSNAGLVNTAYAVDLQPGEIMVDKHRSTYELSPGDTTDISLLVQTEGTTITPVIDLVIAIDISNSMVNNSDGSSTVMQLTQTAAKSLASQVLTASSDSRIALVRYGDFAAVYDFANNQWIKLDDSTTSASLIGNNLYTSDYTALATRIDNIRSNRNAGYIKWRLSDSWDWLTDEGGTTTEAGLTMTTLVAEEATQESFAVFMSDGVPTSRMISRTNGADGRYGISRDDSGTDTSALEKSEAITAANALSSLSDTTTYSIAVTLGLSGIDLTNSQDVMSAVASDPANYYSTSTPAADVNSIYVSIGQTIIDRIAQNAQVIDIVPAYFEVSNLPANISATPQADGTTRLVWSIGDLMAGETTSGYTLTLKPGYYGILDTNVSAVLSYTDHFMGASDPNTAADKTFPIPEIKAQPRASDDAYTTPDNYNPYNIPISILSNDINNKVDNSPYDDRPGSDYTPLSDRGVQNYAVSVVDPLLADGSEGTITGFDFATGLFTYLPNPARPRDPGQTTYTVDFTYRLVTTDAAGAYISNTATVTITVPVPEFQIAVIKRDAINEDPLAGVVFGLYDGNTAGATLLETLPATDTNGYAVSANTYLAGTYYLKEISTIDGYNLNPNDHPVVVSAQQQVGVVTITVDNNRTPYPIGVTKQDAVSSAKLAGVIFGLYDGNTAGATLLETLPATDANGYAETVNDYAPGTYYLKEISTISGYELNPDYHAVVVAIGEGGAATITVNNNRTPYPIGVTKQDAVSGAKLAGVIFGLYDGNTADATLLETLPATDANGYAETVNDYAPGTYYLKEISTISGYELNPDYHAVVVAIGEGGAATITVNNNRTPYPIGVTKQDAVSGAKLAGVIFRLYDGNTADATLLETLPATDANGYAETVNDYAPGTYYLMEISTISGYELNTGCHAVVVAIGEGGAATITVNNSRTPYPIGVTKIDAISEAPLAGVIFRLYDGNTADATLLETLPATDANGYAETVNDYAPGTYYLMEISTISGYELNTGCHAVVVAVGEGGAATITVDNNRTPYPIGVTKIDAISEAPLAGVIFGLYDGNTAGAALLETLPATDANGYAETVNDYAPGTYYLKEISTINGYELNPDYHAVVVAIGEGGAATITVDNNRTPYPIGVTKIDAISEAPLAGVIFGLYDGNTAGATLLETLPATDANGYAETVNDYTPGTYYLKEISTISGYALNPDYHEVVVVIGQGGAATITVTNNRTLYPIEILKLDTDSQTGLAGVVFRIYQEVLNVKVAVSGDLTTNANGIATSEPLTPGQYFIKEISTPNGYILDDTYYPVTVAIGQANGKATISIYNDRTRYPIGVTKQDAVSGAKLAGVIFGLYDGNTAGATLLETLPATDANGYAETVNDYAPGTYYLKEISTISGYELNPDYHAVVVAIGEGGAATITVDNNRTPYRIQVIKIDERDGETRLPGATFELREAVEDTQDPQAPLAIGDLLEELTTDSHGEAVTVAPYSPGQYYLVETVAPAGFHLNEDPILITIGIGSGTEGLFPVTVVNSFIYTPEISIEKLVANDSKGDPLSKLSEIDVGEDARYEVVVTNTGNASLAQVVLTDDQAEAGSGVELQPGGNTIWLLGTGGIATLNLGTLDIGESIKVIYYHTAVEDDVERSPIINTVVVSGIMEQEVFQGDEEPVTDSDYAVIEVEEIPLVLAEIDVVKQVENDTQNGVPAELAGGYAGDSFLYTVTVTNTGSADLSGVVLTDDKAVAGAPVKNVTTDTIEYWQPDGTNPVYLIVGDLAAGQTVTYTYEYISSQTDLEELRINTAYATGTVTSTLDDPEPMTVEDEDDAIIAVDEIPQTGESGSTLYLGLGMILAVIVLLTIRRKAARHAKG